MYNIVRIGDRDVPMLAMASVDVYYRNIFHEDAIKVQTKGEESDLVEMIMRMGFIMSEFAKCRNRKDMAKLTEETYLDWLDQFDRAEYLNALGDIRMTYEGQSITTSDAKKNTDGQTEV